MVISMHRMSVVGCTMEAIEQQEAEHRMLEKSLEEQHVSLIML